MSLMTVPTRLLSAIHLSGRSRDWRSWWESRKGKVSKQGPEMPPAGHRVKAVPVPIKLPSLCE